MAEQSLTELAEPRAAATDPASEWNAQTSGYREYGLELRQNALGRAQAICSGDSVNDVTDADLINPKALRSLAQVEDTFKAIAPETHSMFEGYSAKAIKICASSRTRNKLRALGFKKTRALEVRPFTNKQVEDRAAKDRWRAARSRAKSTQDKTVKMALLDLFEPSKVEIQALAKTLDIMAKANLDFKGIAAA